MMYGFGDDPEVRSQANLCLCDRIVWHIREYDSQSCMLPMGAAVQQSLMHHRTTLNLPYTRCPFAWTASAGVRGAGGGDRGGLCDGHGEAAVCLPAAVL